MTMQSMLTGPLAQAIGWALLHLLWQGALIAGLLLAVLALLRERSANARYLAACGALVLMMVLPIATAYRAYEKPSPAVDAAPVVASAGAPIAEMHAPIVSAAEEASPTLSERAHRMGNVAAAHFPQIIEIWLAGVLLLSLRLLGGWLRASQLAKRNGALAALEWQRILTRLASTMELRRTILMLESAAVEVPTVIGWLRPVILLPVSMLSGLSREQIEMILAHELAHIRRHDFFVNMLQAMVETLLFYHPAVWWISRQIREEREHCCDDIAVEVCGSPLQYARALTRLEELRVDAVHAVIAANGGSLLTRIRRLVTSRHDSIGLNPRWTAGAAIVTVILAATTIPSLPLLAKRNQPAPAPAPEAAPAPSHSQIDVTVSSTPDSTSDESSSSEAWSDSESDTTPPDPPEVSVAPVPPTPPAAAVAVTVHAAPPAPPAPVAPTPAIAPPAPAIHVTVDTERALAVAMAHARSDRERGHKIAADGKLTVDDLIELRINGVDPQYIHAMREVFGDVSLSELLNMRVQGVTPEYVRDMRDAGLDIKSVDRLIALRQQGVTADWIRGMKQAGIDKFTTDDLVAMRIQGIDGKFVAGMNDAGYRNLSVKELIALRIQGVSPAFVKSLADAGYTNLSVKDLLRLAASGVNADFIREMAKYKQK